MVDVKAGHRAYAFEPTIAVDSHGTVGMTWYYLCNDRPGDDVLTADVWFPAYGTATRMRLLIALGVPAYTGNERATAPVESGLALVHHTQMRARGWR
jgi:hypothetical protein